MTEPEIVISANGTMRIIWPDEDSTADLVPRVVLEELVGDHNRLIVCASALASAVQAARSAGVEINFADDVTDIVERFAVRLPAAAKQPGLFLPN